MNNERPTFMDSPVYDVLSFGTLGIDRILRIPHWPAPHLSTHTLSESITLGGKATNTAASLAAWGARVAITGTTIGADDTGRLFQQLVSQHQGISTEFVEQRDGIASMYCCILVNADGERAIIGVNTNEVIATKPTVEMVGSAAVVTLDLYGGEERVEVARMAQNANRPVIVGDLRDAAHPILAYTSVAIASAAEVRDTYPKWTVDDFAHRTMRAGAKAVVITDGGNAVGLYLEDEKRATLNPPNLHVIDATGAGDAFRAGITYGVLKGWGMEQAAAFGAAAGSLTVQRIGAASNPAEFDVTWEMAREILRRSGSSTRREV
jgi:ribokinase